ncbi:MAG: FtsX-like permease family protein [Oscillospiraceae bacterium]
MKKTYLKIVFRTIKHSFSRFVAIFAIVALGVGFLAGLLACTPDMSLSADKYFDNSKLFDIRILGDLGLTDNDVEIIKSIEEVDEVMATHTQDLICNIGGNKPTVTRVHGLPLDKINQANSTDYINKVDIKEGRLPNNKDECVIDIGKNKEIDIKLGDTIKFSSANKNLSDNFYKTKYSVVGFVESSYYFSNDEQSATVGDGIIDIIMYISDENFKLDVYTDIYLTIKNSTNYNSFSDDYEKSIDKSQDIIEEIGNERSIVRYNDIKSEIQDGENEFNTEKEKALKELDDAKNKIDNSDEVIALKKGKSDIQKAKNSIKTNENLLDEKQTEIENADEQIANAVKQKDDLEKNILNLEKQIEVINSNNELSKYEKRGYAKEYSEQLAILKATVEKMDTEISSQSEALEKGKVEISNGRTEIEKAKSELRNAEKEITNGEIELQKAVDKFEEEKVKALKELDDAEKKLIDEKADFARLKTPKWYVLDRETNIGFASFDNNIQKVAAIARVFPIFFFLVAALVALTTMTRMVEEERGQIGTLKALGYSKSTIASKYVFYSIVATFLGSIAGLLVGFNVLPRVIWNAYTTMYRLPKLYCQFNLFYAAIATAAAIFSSLIATSSACKVRLNENASTLMLPPVPEAGKRILLEYITPIWKRMKFTHKVTARNLFRYKKRFFMTTFGIAGCTALLLTGFGIRNSIGEIINKQYNEILLYDFSISINDEKEKSPELLKIVDNPNYVEQYLLLHQETVDNKFDSGNITIQMIVPTTFDGFDSFIQLKNRKSQEKLDFPTGDNEVIITEKLAEKSKTKVGDKILIENDDKMKSEFIVSGITENYVNNYVYMTAETYKNAYYIAPNNNTFLAKSNQSLTSYEEVTTKLLETDDVNGVNLLSTMSTMFDDMLGKINYIVYVLIVAAALLAFVVLYNLTNININERIKEIATIKVLGFYDKEVAAYIYRESIILSAIGALMGLLLGIILHKFVIVQAESDMLMFGRSIKLLSYFISFILTMIFSFIVNGSMYGKLKRIDMVESMKAPE